jgi:hypothetical protein
MPFEHIGDSIERARAEQERSRQIKEAVERDAAERRRAQVAFEEMKRREVAEMRETACEVAAALVEKGAEFYYEYVDGQGRTISRALPLPNVAPPTANRTTSVWQSEYNFRDIRDHDRYITVGSRTNAHLMLEDNGTLGVYEVTSDINGPSNWLPQRINGHSMPFLTSTSHLNHSAPSIDEINQALALLVVQHNLAD